MKLQPRISWRSRKRYLYAVTAFSMLMAVYAAIAMSDESRVAETVIVAAFTLLGACVGSYVFGAVWQDTAINRDAAADEESKVDYEGKHE